MRPAIRLRLIAAVAILGIALFFIHASRYDLLLAVDSTDLILPLKILADPSLLAGHPLRAAILESLSPLQWAISKLAALFHWNPVAVEYARLFLFNVLAVAVVAKISWNRFRRPSAAALAALLLVGGGMGAVGLGFDWRLGVFAEWHYIGFLFGLFVLEALYARDYIRTGLMLGLLAWAHPSHALIMGVVAAATVLFCDRRGEGRRIALGAFTCLAVALPAVWMLLPRVGLQPGTGTDPDLWWEMLRARKSHHIFPLSWSPRLWAGVLIVVAAGWRTHTRLRSEADGDEHRRTSVILLSLGALCAAGLVFTEFIPVMLAAKLALFRASGYIIAILAMDLCVLVSRLLSLRGFDRMLGAVIGLAMATAGLWLKFAVPILVGAVWWATQRLRRTPPAVRPGEAAGIAVPALLVAATLVNAYLEAMPPVIRPEFRRAAQLRPWKELQGWAEQDTPKNAIFVNPPHWCGFEAYSERAQILSICDVGRSVYATGTADEEYRRIRAFGDPALANQPISAAYLSGLPARYEALREEELLALGEAFDASFAIMPKPSVDRSLPLAYENAGFVVYRLRDQG